MIYPTITQNFKYLFRCGVQVQEKLRLDLRRKIEALDIDMTCFSLDNRLILLPPCCCWCYCCCCCCCRCRCCCCCCCCSNQAVQYRLPPALTRSGCIQEFTRRISAPVTHRQTCNIFITSVIYSNIPKTEFFLESNKYFRAGLDQVL